MADLIKNTLWAVVLVLVLSLAMDVAGVTLHDDYDGKQVTSLFECQELGQKAVTKPNGTLYQDSLVCDKVTR